MVVCFGEYYDNFGYKVLVSFKRELKLPKELELIVNDNAMMRSNEPPPTDERRSSVSFTSSRNDDSINISPRFSSRFKSYTGKKNKGVPN